MVLQLFNEEGRENAHEDGHSCAENGHICAPGRRTNRLSNRHSDGLHEELDDTHKAIKMAMRWTGASERTVKYWFSGERGPSGDHLIALARHSDAVLYGVLALAGRHIVEEADD